MKPNAYYLLGWDCILMLGVRFPWSDWPPRRKAMVLILLFAMFIVGLRAYSAFCDYVHDTLYDALEDTAATLKPVDVELHVQVKNGTPTGQYDLYMTVCMRNPSRLTVELIEGFYEVALFDAWEPHDHQGFWLGNFTLPAVTLPLGYGFNMTYHFPVNETQAETLKNWGYRARVLLWGGCTLQGTFHYLENYRISTSTKHRFSLEYLPIVDIKVVYVGVICLEP